MVKRGLFALAVCLVACGGGGGGGESTKPTTPSGADTKQSAPKGITPSAEAKAVVGAPDRDEDDKKLDGGRKPAELLTFIGVKPGMKVADLAAGGGYTTELLVRAVGPSGVVYGQNSPALIERFLKEPWGARLAKPVNKSVVRTDRDFDDPLPPEAKDLDAAVMVLFYHDTFWTGTDRNKMNAAVMRALKPGGVYVIVDHSGRPGTGSTEVQTLHRVEEKVVREEIEKAGFKLAAEADFLRNPSDARDWNAAPFKAGEKRGTSDRFVLKYVKP